MLSLILLLQLFISPNRRAYIFRLFFFIHITKLQEKKNCFHRCEYELGCRIVVMPGFLNRLVAVPALAGAEAAIAAAYSAAAAEISPCATTVAAASATTVAAAAAVLLRPFAARAAVGGAGASHFPV
jgi:hypothetical protein